MITQFEIKYCGNWRNPILRPQMSRNQSGSPVKIERKHYIGFLAICISHRDGRKSVNAKNMTPHLILPMLQNNDSRHPSLNKPRCLADPALETDPETASSTNGDLRLHEGPDQDLSVRRVRRRFEASLLRSWRQVESEPGDVMCRPGQRSLHQPQPQIQFRPFHLISTEIPSDFIVIS